jgi:ADP-dependent phosphofructokinase/glucokinase
MPAAIALFKQKKDAILALYRDDVGKLLEDKIARETIDYIEDFYRTINNERDTNSMLNACAGPR